MLQIIGKRPRVGKEKRLGETIGGPFSFVANKRGVCGNKKKKSDQSGKSTKDQRKKKGGV